MAATRTGAASGSSERKARPKAANREEPTVLLAPLYDVLVKAVKTITEKYAHLPQVITLSVTDDQVFVTPWTMGRPVNALLGWHDALTDTTREYVKYGEGSNTYYCLRVRGTLDDVVVTAEACTFRDVHGPEGDLPVEELRRIAQMEIDGTA